MNRPQPIDRLTTREQRQALMALYGMNPMLVGGDLNLHYATVVRVLELKPAPESCARVREYIIARLPEGWTEENFFAKPEATDDQAAA